MIIGLIYRLEAHAKAAEAVQAARDAVEALSRKRLTRRERKDREYPLESELDRAQDEMREIGNEVESELAEHRWPELLAALRELTGNKP